MIVDASAAITASTNAANSASAAATSASNASTSATNAANSASAASTSATNASNSASAASGSATTAGTQAGNAASSASAASTSATNASNSASAASTSATNAATSATNAANSAIAAANSASSIANDKVQAGAIEFYATINAPNGRLKANGTAVLISTYSDLATAIYCGDAANPTASWGYKCTNPANPNGTRSISGTYIVVPDLRGIFVRGFDDGASVDNGRSLFAYQADALASHTHTVSVSGSFNDYRSVFAVQTFSTAFPQFNLIVATGDSTSGNSVNSTGTAAATGGTETRPKNAAMLACIKY